MNNLAQTIEALTIKELEARQEALREELRQIQVLIDIELQVEAQIQEVITSVKNIKKSLQEHYPHAQQRFIASILAALNEQTLPPAQKSNGSAEVSTPKSALQKVVNSVGSAVGKMLEPVEEAVLGEETLSTDNIQMDLHEDLTKEGDKATMQPVALSYVEFVALTPGVGYLRRTNDGAILSAYLGGKNKSLLEIWARCVSREVAAAGGKCEYEVRAAQRLKNSKHEIKFQNISFTTLESLTSIDTSKSPKFRATVEGVEVDEVNKAVLADSAPNDTRVILDDDNNVARLQVGDRVVIKSNRHGEEFVDQDGIVSAASKTGAAVNVCGQLQYFHADEFDVVERSSHPRNPADDLAVSRPIPLDLTAEPVPW